MEAIHTLSTEELEKLLEERKAAEAAQKRQERESYESLRNETVDDLVEEASRVSIEVDCLKYEAMTRLQALAELSQEYARSKRKDWKGSFTIQNADGSRKIEYNRTRLGKFDERSLDAEHLILQFVKDRFAQDRDAQQMITSLLERKSGQLDVKLVQKLYAMEDRFDDPNWKRGLSLLQESWIETGRKDYINFSVRQDDGQYKVICLDFAKADGQWGKNLAEM